MTGGPAFPSGLQEQADDTVDSLHKGMTLRDYFAAKAMAAMVVQRAFPFDAQIPKAAYVIADAMLEARK